MRDRNFLGKIFGRFFSREENQATIDVHERWILDVTGVITELSKVNVDKSGRHPKYVIYGAITLEKYSLQGAEFAIPSPVYFQGKEEDIFEQVKKELVIGEKVTLRCRGLDAPIDRFVIQK